MFPKEFPKNFLWGATTSAHQVEGGMHNDWTEWEKKNGGRLAREAEKRAVREAGLASGLPAISLPPEAFSAENYVSGSSCGHYERYAEDFDLAKSLGHNAHRFSIEWSRIEPSEGVFDEKEIEHYRKVLRALRQRGLEPLTTLWHWTLPVWISRRGGVEDDRFPEYFARYAKKVGGSLGDLVQFWITLNEPTSVLLNGYLRGVWPPQKRSVVAAYRAAKNLARAHREAYNILHGLFPSVRVGFGNILIYTEPHSTSLLDRAAARFFGFWSNDYFFGLTGDTHDFLDLHYYFHSRVKFPFSVRNENRAVSDMGWEIYPEGIYHLLKKLSAPHKPVYITENGIADAGDKKRARFIREHLEWVHKAIQEGVDVRGYFYWSLLDNFEWDKGFWPRFGLFEVDRKTLERKKRPSADVYAEIARTNSLPG
ncbi:MAG: glycoside hydrolase family 1 protein [bacterium]|nr:glycoside hydrolase family 1 protein [bacterium]